MKLHRQVVAEIVASINSANRRRIAEGKGDLSAAAATYREQGLTPHRFRVDLRRAVLGSAWLREMQDYTPDLTDAHLDTAMRAAIRVTFPETARDWAASAARR